MTRTPRGLYHATVALLLAVLWVILWGAYTNSLAAGMAFPDWPTSDGRFLFSLPLAEWWGTGKKFWEHSHRLIAGGLVGPLAIVVFIWSFWAFQPGVYRKLSSWILVAVVAQGILGGSTVLAGLKIKELSIAHAGLAQICLALVTSLVVLLSTSWCADKNCSPLKSKGFALLPWAVLAQTLLGALYRHKGETSALMWHITGAVILAAIAFWVAIAILTNDEATPRLRRGGVALLALLGLQLVLGILAWVMRTKTEGLEVIPWNRAHLASFHVFLGSIFMALAIYLYLHARRPRPLLSVKENL